jgi:hypothetical protein
MTNSKKYISERTIVGNADIKSASYPSRARINTPTTHAEEWPLTFRAVGPGPEPAIRVRRLLKAALRSYGLRCISLADHAEPAEQSAGLRRRTNTIQHVKK